MLRILLIPLRFVRFLGAAFSAYNAERSQRMRYVARVARVMMRLFRITPLAEEERLLSLFEGIAGQTSPETIPGIRRMLDMLENDGMARRFLVGHEFTDQRPFFFNPRRLGEDQLEYLIDRIITHDSYALNRIETPNPVIVDGGAHIGVFSRFVFQKFPDARLYALEPDRENFDLLRINLCEHDAAVIRQNGILDGNETLDFYVSNEIDWRSSLNTDTDFINRYTSSSGEYEKSYMVHTTSIDDLLENEKPERLDLLKLVVPGEIELRVLDGASNTIKKYKPQVVVTVYKDNEAKVEAFFEELDYQEIPSPWRPPTDAVMVAMNRLYIPK